MVRPGEFSSEKRILLGLGEKEKLTLWRTYKLGNERYYKISRYMLDCSMR